MFGKTLISTTFFLLINQGMAAELISPVSLTNYIELANAQDEFRSKSQNKAFQALIELLYDRVSGRPWGDKYLAEFDRVWQTWRSYACPQSTKLCALPAAVSEQKTLDQILKALADGEMQKDLLLPMQDSSDLVDFPGVTAETGIPNVLSAAKKETVSHDGLHLWNLSGSFTETDRIYTTVHDLPAYLASYNMDGSNAVFALNQQGGTTIEIDKLKDTAQKVAALWKFNSENAMLNQIDLKSFKLNDAEAYSALKLEDLYKERFDYYLKTLTEKLKALPPEQSQETLDRFKKEAADKNYPEEVYQYVVYELLLPIIRAQASYFALAAHGRPQLSSEFKIWESLLTAQAYGGGKTTLHFMLDELVIPRNLALAQTVNPRIGALHLLEEVKFILQFEPYSDPTAFERLGHVFHAADLLNEDYVKDNAPDLVADLKDPKSGKIRDVFSLSTESQLHILRKLLMPEPGKYRMSGLLRLAFTLEALISEEEAQGIAKAVHATQFRQKPGS